LREIFFDENNVKTGLRQAYSKLVHEGFDSYTILGIGDGGKHIVDGLIDCGFSGNTLLCPFENREPIVLDESEISNKKILVCEDTTITGKSFLSVYTQLRNLGADDVKFLSFLMRRGSSIVPNIFIFETEEDTKVYFPWSDYPIRTYSKGIIRKITSDDIENHFICGDSRIDKTTLSDFYTNHRHRGAKVYLVEDKSEICAIIQFYEQNYDTYNGLFLDIIATAQEKHGNKYGSTLLKLILHYMFYHEFNFIYGYAFDNSELIRMYEAIGFEVVGSVQNPHYDTLHKLAIVNETKSKKDLVINTIRSHI
jgi:hypoxanthine-guanine phosphoribosyltransferase